MKMLWTVEPDGSLILRGFKHEPLVHIGRADPANSTFIRPGFVGTLIEAGMPSCGPYKSRATVAEWAMRIMRKRIPDVEFSDVPRIDERTPKRRVA